MPTFQTEGQENQKVVFYQWNKLLKELGLNCTVSAVRPSTKVQLPFFFHTEGGTALL